MAGKTTAKALKVPEQYRQSLALLANLTDASFVELQSALKNTAYAGGRKELIVSVAANVKSINQTDLQGIIEALTSLYRVQVDLGVATDKLANDLASSMEEVEGKFGVASEQHATFAERVAELIALPSLDVADTKISGLRGEYERTFCDVRILTDLRPVFRSNISDPPTRMLIMHTLKLEYHGADGAHTEFFIALDSSELRKIKEAIQRAETKMQTLKSQLTAIGVKPIDVE